MSAARAHIKDTNHTLPVSPILERFRDPRDERQYEGYRIVLSELTEDDWSWILADVRSRWPDSPMNLRETIELQGGFPVRNERVEFLEIDPRFLASDGEELDSVDNYDSNSDYEDDWDEFS